MKVLLIAPGYPPVAGGVETHVSGLARGLVRLGVDVEVWAPDREVPVLVSEELSGVLVRRFPSTRSARFPVAPQLYRCARRDLGPGPVVHAHGFHNIAAAAVLSVRRPIPFVFTPHFHGGGHTRAASIAHVGYRPIGRRLFGKARTVIAVSQAEASLIRHTYPEVRPRVIHNGADLADIRSAAPWPDERPTLLVLGRLEAYKRVDRVLEAFDHVRVPGQLVVIGDGPDRERLTRLAGHLARAGDIRFLGRLPRPEVNRWLRTARGVVSMSEREAFGLVALEGAAAGGAAVLSDIPAHREVARLLPPRVTELCPPTTAAIAAALEPVLTRPKAGVRRVRDWSVVAAEHLEIYRGGTLRRVS